MIGAVAGDMIGSVYEAHPIKHLDFDPVVCGFTDDTVLTLAVADAILHGRSYATVLKTYARRYPDVPYGRSFRHWAESEDDRPYDSFGNGSAMRVSPVGFAFDAIPDVLDAAFESAAVTHNHPEGIKGAQATALAVYLAKIGADKQTIRSEIAGRFSYRLDAGVDDIRPGYGFDVSCQGSVPESIIAFLDSDSYVDAVKKAISLGGDADTMACIAGGIAQAFYKKIPPEIVAQVNQKLPVDLREVLDEFNRTYRCAY
jgi:ADP-ribosylglycohydrolase